MEITSDFSVGLLIYQLMMILIAVLAIVFFVHVFKVFRKLNKFLDRKLDENKLE